MILPENKKKSECDGDKRTVKKLLKIRNPVNLFKKIFSFFHFPVYIIGI